MIYFITPDINTATGGIKQIYRQVDILNRNQIEASILHENEGFKCTWFANNTVIHYNKNIFAEIEKLNPKKVQLTWKNRVKILLKSIKNFKLNTSNQTEIKENDILVFPEIYGPKIAQLYKGIKKVIYNQGVYQTFFGYNNDLTDLKSPYLDADLMAVIVNSKDAKQYLNYVFPSLTVHRIHYGIDSQNFSHTTDKKKYISFMPRKLQVDIAQVINILKFRGSLNGWELLPIDKMSEAQVAKALKESALFLSFNINEGFGMPPAEAMACGCIVVGYTGKGGDEIFVPDFTFPVPDRNIQIFAKTLEEVIQNFNSNMDYYRMHSEKASRFILSEYSMQVEESDIVNVWNQILSKN